MEKLKQILKEFSRKSIILNQRRKINTLEVKLKTLEDTIKNELYKEFMQKLNETDDIIRLTKENKRLRLKNKELREMLKGDDL